MEIGEFRKGNQHVFGPLEISTGATCVPCEWSANGIHSGRDFQSSKGQEGLLLKSGSLFPQILCGLLYKGAHRGRDRGFAYTWHGLPLTKADVDAITAEFPTCQHQKPTLRPHYGTWWQVHYIAPLPSHRGRNFSSLELLSRLQRLC